MSRESKQAWCVCAHACVFMFEKPRKPDLTFLSACDPLLTGLTRSINKMSLKTNQKTKGMNPHLNKDNIIIVAGWEVYKMLLERFLLSLNLMSKCHERFLSCQVSMPLRSGLLPWPGFQATLTPEWAWHSCQQHIMWNYRAELAWQD